MQDAGGVLGSWFVVGEVGEGLRPSPEASPVAFQAMEDKMEDKGKSFKSLKVQNR